MSTLSVLIEASACSWGKVAETNGEKCMGTIMRAIVSFCNAHMALSAANQLLVFAYGRNIPQKLLYCSSRPGDRDASSLIVQRLRQVLIDSAESDDCRVGVPLAPAMAHAICHMKKDNKRMTAEACADSLNTANPTATGEQDDISEEKSITRAVVIGMTPVCGGEHSSLMNLFFSAAKQNICVDVISLADDDTGGILQQASDITGGLFLHTPKPENLLKILMVLDKYETEPNTTQFFQTHVLADPAYRAAFPQPTLDSVDYRASCACHHQLVSNGWVCSVCLSVLCQYMPICKVCKSVFKITHLPKKILKRKRKD